MFLPNDVNLNTSTYGTNIGIAVPITSPDICHVNPTDISCSGGSICLNCVHKITAHSSAHPCTKCQDQFTNFMRKGYEYSRERSPNPEGRPRLRR